jgi:precorrin-3B C17-methyltransferase
MRDFYDVYIGGKAKGKDAQIEAILFEAFTPEQLYDTIQKPIDIYAQNGKKRELFAKLVNWYRLDTIKQQLLG